MKKNICEVEDIKNIIFYIFQLLETKCYRCNNVENNGSEIFSS